MEPKAEKIMLLGLAVLLFTLTFRVGLGIVIFAPLRLSEYQFAIALSILSLIGIGLVIVGYFSRAR